MKRCPECRRDYYDDSLLYCLDDGSALLEGPASADGPPTAILSEPPESAGGQFSESATRPKILTTTAEAEPRASFGDLTEKRSFSARRAKPLAAGAVALLLLGVGFFGYRYLSAGGGPINSIAVLPFANATGDKETDFLADGLAETLINNFTKIADLKVAARSTAFRFRGREDQPQEIGRELGVGSVLTGRLMQRGDNLSIQVDLINTTDGTQIWGNRYEGKVSDIVNIQQRIATEVSQQLKLKLTGAQSQQVARTYTQNAEAYQHYLRGRHYWNKRTAENLKKATEQFQRASDIDPNYALAYAGLADCYVVLGDYTGTLNRETLPKSRAFAERALQLDPSLIEAQTTLAYGFALVWQWDRAETEFKKALELDPNYPTTHHWYSLTLVETGRFEEAMQEIKRAQELDPLSLIISYNVALNYLLLGDVNASVEQSKRLVDLDPNFPRAHQVLGQGYLKQARYPEAIAEFQKAVSLSPGDRQALRELGYGYAVSGSRTEALAVLKQLQANYEKGEAFPSDVAAVFAGLGDKDQAFLWLEKDFQAREGRLARIRYHMPYESLRGDPRYADLLRRMGLPE